MMKSWHLRSNIIMFRWDTIQRHNSGGWGETASIFHMWPDPEMVTTNPGASTLRRWWLHRSSALPSRRWRDVRFVALLWQRLYLRRCLAFSGFGWWQASHWYCTKFMMTFYHMYILPKTQLMSVAYVSLCGTSCKFLLGTSCKAWIYIYIIHNTNFLSKE